MKPALPIQPIFLTRRKAYRSLVALSGNAEKAFKAHAQLQFKAHLDHAKSREEKLKTRQGGNHKNRKRWKLFISWFMLKKKTENHENVQRLIKAVIELIKLRIGRKQM